MYVTYIFNLHLKFCKNEHYMHPYLSVLVLCHSHSWNVLPYIKFKFAFLHFNPVSSCLVLRGHREQLIAICFITLFCIYRMFSNPLHPSLDKMISFSN